MKQCVFEELKCHINYFLTFKLPKNIIVKNLKELDNPEVLSYHEALRIEKRLIDDLRN